MKSFQTFYDVISYWANETPDAPALLAKGQLPLNYLGLSEIVTEFHESLSDAGLDRNERVAVVHSGGADMAAAMTALACSVTVVPLNPASTTGEFYLHFQDKRINALALEGGLQSNAREAAKKLNIPILDIEVKDSKTAGKVRLAGKAENEANINSKPAKANDLLVVFTTSGTTSYGKTVPLSHRLVMQRVANMVEMLKLTRHDRLLNIMPLFHTGGFSAGMLTALYSGASFFPIKNNDVDLLLHSLVEARPTIISGGYTVFHSIERKAADYKEAIDAIKPSLRMLRTGTGHLDQKVSERLEAIFNAPVIEAYGSAETSFMSCSNLPPLPRKPGSVGQPCRKRVSVVDQNETPVPVGEKGEIVVRRDTVFEGYENNPIANKDAFTRDWYHTGDEGYLDEDGFLFVTGRLKEMINRGGVKIIPTEIDQAAVKHDAVREAVAFPLPHKTLGDDLALAIVLETNKSISESDLKAFLKTTLIPNKIPSHIIFVEEVPKAATGKPQRRKLHQQLALTIPSGSGGKLRMTDKLSVSEEKLKNIWQQVLGRENVGPDESFFALGGDSLQAVDLFMRIEKELNRCLPRDVLFEAGTIREMARLIDDEQSASCIVPVQPNGDRPPLFFVHPIGGEVLGYRELARYLGADQPFYGIQQFRSGENFTRYSSLEEMADFYLDEIRRLQPVGPYFLGGHSFGGIVAYLIAQKLSALGEEVAFLALLDSYLPNSKRYISPQEWLLRHCRIWLRLPFREKPGYMLQRIKNINKAVIRAVRLKLLSIAKGKKTQEKNPISNIDINSLNARNYRPTPYDGNAILFRTELPISIHPDVHKEWHNLVNGNLEICEISGGHVEIMKDPNVRELASKLTAHLKKAQDEMQPA
ncbi:MAG: non-ribosomal peptide synthetase [Sneathiella sp.]